MDLLDFFRGRHSWRKFYNFLTRLPSHGHYKSELAMDAGWAARVLDLEELGKGIPPSGDNDPTPLGYTDVISRLDVLIDRVMAVRTAVQASYTEKNEEPHFDPVKRPVTAIDKERERRARKVLLEVEAEIFGGGLDFQVLSIE